MESEQGSKSYIAECPFEVRQPVMFHRWDRLTFLHWSYDVDRVQALLPDGLRVEPYDGRAWVGLVPFFMKVRLRGLPSVPWLLNFPETNVRTYVKDRNGNTGVWFFSLDASRLAAVVTARSTYRMPYFWSKMSVLKNGSAMEYESRRRRPGPRGAGSQVVVEISDVFAAEQLSDFDHYLTARFRLFGTWGGRLLTARAEHPPWILHRVSASHCDDDLVAAAGLPAPDGDPIVHWSPGADVRIGRPTRVR